MYIGDGIYRDCVISNGRIRETTEIEKMLVEWCFGKNINEGVSNIGYATFEMELYQEKWFEDAKTAFMDSIKNKKKLNKFENKLVALLNYKN